MEYTLTITVDDSVYEILEPFIKQQTVDSFLSNIIKKNAVSFTSSPDIKNLRGTLHQVDISDIREKDDRKI